MADGQRSRRRASDVTGPNEELLIRVLTLADYAVTPPDGKLYIAGGGIEQILIPEIPGQLGPIYLAVRVRVPWSKTSEPLPFLVRALDADREPVGPDPLLRGVAEVGRAPGQRPGDELGVNLVVPLGGFPVKEAGNMYFHVVVADETIGVLPMKVDRAPKGARALGDSS